MGNKYERYLTFDDPIPYWQHDILEKDRNDDNCLLFYPVLIKDIFEFYNYCGCLLTDHTSEIDKSLPMEEAIKVISMSCYEYLFYSNIIEPEKKPYISMFNMLLSICLRNDRYKNLSTIELNKAYNVLDKNKKPVFLLENILYDSVDFDNIKEIISTQNDLEIPDIEKDKRFRDAIELARKRKAKILGNNNKMISFEDQLICLCLGYSIPYENIVNISLRKFKRMLTYMNKKANYDAYLQASLTGLVKFKDESVLKHWMVSDEKDKYDDVILNVDDVNNVINGKND